MGNFHTEPVCTYPVRKQVFAVKPGRSNIEAKNWAQAFRGLPGLSGTGDSQRDSRESIRTNHSQFKCLFLRRIRPIRANRSNFRFARITPLSAGMSEKNPGISRQKSLISLVSRDIPNFLAPTPSCGRPPPHRKISRLKSLLGLCSFFVPDKRPIKRSP